MVEAREPRPRSPLSANLDVKNLCCVDIFCVLWGASGGKMGNRTPARGRSGSHFLGQRNGSKRPRCWRGKWSARGARLRAMRILAAAVVSAVLLAGCTGPGLRPSTTGEPSATVRVVSVSDGDTLTALDANGEKVRVRLLGIDAPETATDDGPAQCGAHQATETLRRLITGRTLTLTEDPVADPIDRFGRHLAYATVDDRDVALTLVQAGMAEAWYPNSEPQPAKYRAYRTAEGAARAANAGLWATCPSIGR